MCMSVYLSVLSTPAYLCICMGVISVVPQKPVDNLSITPQSTALHLQWTRPDLLSLRGALTHYKIVYNRTLLSGVAFNLTTASLTVSVSSPMNTQFSQVIDGLTAGSRFEVSVEPCRLSICGPAAKRAVNTTEIG